MHIYATPIRWIIIPYVDLDFHSMSIVYGMISKMSEIAIIIRDRLRT